MEDRSEQGIVDTKQGVYRWDDSIGWVARADQDRAAHESHGTVYDRPPAHLGATRQGGVPSASCATRRKTKSSGSCPTKICSTRRNLKKILSRCLPAFLLLAPALSGVRAATIDEIVTAAKKEGEFNFIAGAQTFGGKKAMAEIEEAFNKKYGLKARINFAAGPDMNAMAARVITEGKSGNKSSTDFYLGSQSHYALLHQQNALEKVDWY